MKAIFGNGPDGLDVQERFLLAVDHWENLSVSERQEIVDRTDLEMTLIKLKSMGLIDGYGEMDLQLYGMLYGYAYAKGFRANMSEENIRKMLGESFVFLEGE